MSRQTKPKDYSRALRAVAESQGSSDGDDGLDIIKTTRRELDMSQYIEELTQSQSQSQDADRKKTHSQDTTDDEGVTEVSRSQFKRQKRRINRQAHDTDDGRKKDSTSEEEDIFDFFDDGDDAYEKFKNRTTMKRKRAAAETNRIRAKKKSRAEAATSVVGRKVRAKKAAAGPSFNPDADADDLDNETFLDEPTPKYIDDRRKALKKLHEAGLRYPPNFDDIGFSDSDSDSEKPLLDKSIKPQQPKRDIIFKSSKGVIPAPIAQWLRDYQVDGASFLHERFVKQTGAILGDDMGLGKTIQVIAFLTAAFGKTATKRDSKFMRAIRRYDDERWYPLVLLVCPGTLMQNWEDELCKWGWWHVSRFHGQPADRAAVLSSAKKGSLEIMITTYDTYRNNEGTINTINWDCVIADECHQLRNKASEITKAMNKVNALCRIGLTGTAIQNKYEELWNLLNWARPGAYGSAQEWKQMISIPLKMGQAHDASHQQLADARSRADELANDILPGVFLRRMKTLIADQLPKKSDRVIFCQMTNFQSDAYRTFIESERCEFLREAREPCDCNSGKKRGWCCYQKIPGEDELWSKFVFPCIVTLQKLANHLALLIPSNLDPIEKQNKDVATLELACPDEWRRLDKLRDKVMIPDQRKFCGKWKVLRRLLDFWHSNGDKVLVFSHSKKLLRLLKALFDLDGTKYNLTYLDGDMSYEERANAVADFNSDPNQFVFLISTRAGGVGLNITSANKVVVVDPHWNPAYDLQAQDRAYRIGQVRDVEVFRLVSSGTIEEIVYARQIYKQQQANIGYNASHERRYFKGVMDLAGKKGELFGLENLLTFQEDNVLLREIMHKTNVAETRAGVSALAINFEDSQIHSDDEDDILSNQALGIADDDMSMNAQMKKIAMSFSSDRSSSSNGKNKAGKRRTGIDPVNAILAKAGVQYTHDNSEVIGRSEIESKLSKQAMELRNDTELSKKPVFFSQSQSQSQSQRRLQFADDADYSPEASDNNDDIAILGEGARGSKEFKIHYKYRPSEEIRKRQFNEMSRMWGYDDPVEFALVVESMTQEERRKTLDKFYRLRRKKMGSEFGNR
ncbi:hypothetical protein DM02DRAFT_560210 [Periconia macrospinosa]|uniref:Uncharacterized protein n=1 Tax=Periconia macrospinosa TaxID=97972 RepID=A0A2V1DW62_9PLEO|nr:hypothetical protein DM02DRAFT_560210 [Periconia macrospinosa]